MALVASLVWGAGCGGQTLEAPAPTIRCDACGEATLIAPLQPLEVEATWMGRCEDSAFEQLTSRDESPGRVLCDGREIEVRLRCSAPCAVGGDADGQARNATGQVYLTVAPKQAGPFSFVVTMRELATGEHHEYRSPEMTARYPDAILLTCRYGDSYEPCDQRAMDGSDAYFRIFGELRGRRWVLPQVTINGARHTAAAQNRGHDRPFYRREEGLFSIGEIFPGHTNGGRVRAGEYPLEIGFGEMRVERTLRVR